MEDGKVYAEPKKKTLRILYYGELPECSVKFKMFVTMRYFYQKSSFFGVAQAIVRITLGILDRRRPIFV